MSSIIIPRAAALQLQPMIWTRNGKSPDALFQQQLVSAANQCAHYRVKELARFVSPIADIPPSMVSETRWRFACHTSPFAKYILVRMVLAPGFRDTGDDPPGGALVIRNGAGTVLGAAICRYGDGDTEGPDTPAYFGSPIMPLISTTVGSIGELVVVPPSTDLYGELTDITYGRLVAATVYEFSLDPDTDNGYLPNGYSAGTPVFDEDRGDLVELARDLWKRQASPLWNWSANGDSNAPVTIDNTYRNLVDNSSTVVSAATPGATFVLNNRSRLGLTASGVPCIMKVYAKSGSGSGGAVRLVDSAGVVKATCSTFGTTASWVSSGAFFLPATTAKYDLHFSHIGLALGVNFTAYAVSIYQYEA